MGKTLTLVPDTDCWLLADEFHEVYSPASSIEEAFQQFILTPGMWPERVRFWLGITHGMEKQRALKVLRSGMKRANWVTVGLLYTYRTTSLIAERAIAIDFNFLGHLLDAMLLDGFQFFSSDETKPEVSIKGALYALRATVSRMRQSGLVQREPGWDQRSCCIQDESLFILGIEWRIE